jgi:hypothetical protein
MHGKSLRIACLVLTLSAAAVAIAAQPFQQDAGPDALVSVEAEHYDNKFETTSNTWALVTTAAGFTAAEGFSGGEAMQIMPDTPLGGRSVSTNFVQNSPRLDFQVNFVKTGTYYPWILAFGRDGNADSAHIGIDGLAFDTSDNLSGWNNIYRWRNTTMEGPRSTFEVTTVGVHTLNLYMREDGTVFDKVVLTLNPDYTPTGHGPAESSRGIPDWATGPVPADGATDVPRVVTLAWTGGPLAAAHDVYLGTSLDDVSNATRANPLGVLVSQGQDANTYDPPVRFEFGQQYYWRVDEVNAPPDATIVKGRVWSLTAEPFVYRMQNIIATASSSAAGVAPENTVNGSGLNAEGLHSMAEATMWVSDKAGPQPTWIQYEFDGVYKLYELWVWNYNHSFESTLGFGFNDVTIEYSVNGADWTVLGEVQFAQGPAQDGYAHLPPVDMQGVPAQYVRLTANSNFSGMSQFGLSEVQFFYIPAHPREPKPAAGATAVDVDTMLSWRAGREAASHTVYLSTEQQAVAEGTAPAGTSDVSRFDPGPLDFGRTYYWKVSEVNEAETPAAWDGAVWSFATTEYLVVDDFESYNDEEDQGTRIYETWIDGYADGSSGSIVGYIEPPFAEQTIVHGGKQSMPMDYNNVNTPFFSEAQRTWDTPQDWSAHGAEELVLYFRGNRIGFLERSPGTFTMSGVGTDIYNTSDEFQFACKPLSGDGTIIARVDSIENADPWSKAGVMVREGLEPGARFAAVYATPGNGVRFQARLLSAGSATSDTSIATDEQKALQAPVWIKLERTGLNINCYYSTDGTKWTPMSWNPQTIVANGPVYIGLAVTSHVAGVAATGEFSGVSVTGATGSWQQVAIGVAQPDNDPDQLYVAVQDSANHLKIVKHADPQATLLDTWQRWSIPLADLQSGGVNVKAVKKLYIGVGDRDNPVQAGAGRIYIDDIGVGHSAAATP